MGLLAGCPQCASEVTQAGDRWTCPDHGTVTPLWRAEPVDYTGFTQHLEHAGSMPTLLPWPLTPGWAITDFGCVARPGHEARATYVTCSGTSDLDGLVDLTVVSEEPGVGLGARWAGLRRSDPGADIGEGPPHVKVRIDGHPVPLWSVLTASSDTAFDRSVFAGEALGRWLWMVLRPASAALLLKDEWILMNLADLGPELVDLPFGGAPPPW